MFDWRKRSNGEAVWPRPDDETELLMATTKDDHDDEPPAGDGWEDDEMDFDEEMSEEEKEAFNRWMYPPEWNKSPESRKTYRQILVADFQTTAAAALWHRAVELVTMQGYMPDEAGAEVMRRCMKVSRRNRQARERFMRQFEREEAEYSALAADTNLCEWPWGRLCPEHTTPLIATRSGTRCRVEGCERRWPRGFHSGHCDLPAAVITRSSIKSSGQWRLCAGHRRMFPQGELIRVLPSPTGQARPDPADMIESPESKKWPESEWPESGA